MTAQDAGLGVTDGRGDRPAQLRRPYQHRPRVHGHALTRETGGRNVVGAEHLSQLDPGQVGDHHVARMGVHDGLYLRPGAKKLGVDVEFVRDRVAAVEVARAVEVNDADVLGDREQQSAILGASAAQQDPVGIQPDADVPENVCRQALLRQDPAGGGDGGPRIAHAIAATGVRVPACSTPNTSDLMVTGTVLDG